MTRHVCTSLTFRPLISLDPVVVRIDDEGGIVIGAAYRPQAACTVVLPASAQPRPRDGKPVALSLRARIAKVRVVE